MTTQLALDFSLPPDPAFPVCPFCGEEQDVDMLSSNVVDWIPCCLEAREAVTAEGWEQVFGTTLESTLSEWLGADVREVVIDSSQGDSLARFALQLENRTGEVGWQGKCFEMIDDHHRHLDHPVGWKFGVEVKNGPSLVGVVVVGRPVAKALQAQGALEITRCCVWGPYELRHNAASMLYGAACREAKRRGCKRVVTYTMEGETGASLRASGFVAVAETRGGSWNRPSRSRKDKAPTCRKTRWERAL